MKHVSYITDFEEWRKDFYFSIPIKVRFSETDAYAHLNNTKPFIYFEEVRLYYFRSLGFTEWENPTSDKGFVVADLQCDFIRQVFFNERLTVYIKLVSFGNSSVDLHYLIENESEEPCIVGRGAVVQISKKDGTAVPWDGKIRKRFEEEINKSKIT